MIKSQPKLLNPIGKLLPDIEGRLLRAKKTKPLWAKLIGQIQSIASLEGTIIAGSSNYMCRGIQGEKWPQEAGKLQEKYSPSGEIDSDGWERFDPRPDSAMVEVAQVNEPFRIIAQWGELTGKTKDYVVRSSNDPTDIWIVDCAVFLASYELAPLTSRPLTLDTELCRKVIPKNEPRDETLDKLDAGRIILISQINAFELSNTLDEKQSNRIDEKTE